MPVRVPRFRPLSGDVIGTSDINELFQETLGDITSNLNEHSFRDRAFYPSTGTLVAGNRWLSDSMIRAHQTAVDVTSGGSILTLGPNSTGQVVLELDVDTVGSTLYCMASFELLLAFAVDGYGQSVKVWITVNGAVCSEATIGSLDQNGKFDAIGFTCSEIGQLPTTTGRVAGCVDTVQVVPPGTARVQLVMQANKSQTGFQAVVRNRELVVLEMVN